MTVSRLILPFHVSGGKEDISQNHTVIFDPESLACKSSAKGAFVMGTPHCYLEKDTVRLAGRPDAIPLVMHLLAFNGIIHYLSSFHLIVGLDVALKIGALAIELAISSDRENLLVCKELKISSATNQAWLSTPIKPCRINHIFLQGMPQRTPDATIISPEKFTCFPS